MKVGDLVQLAWGDYHQRRVGMIIALHRVADDATGVRARVKWFSIDLPQKHLLKNLEIISEAR
jgi:hypothetical protein